MQKRSDSKNNTKTSKAAEEEEEEDEEDTDTMVAIKSKRKYIKVKPLSWKELSPGIKEFNKNKYHLINPLQMPPFWGGLWGLKQIQL